MNSKTSFSKGLFINDIKRFKWMGLAYFLALFLIVPLRVILMYNGNIQSRYYEQIKYIFSMRNEFQIMLMVVVPILLGILIFRYLQVMKNTDFIHSLPYKRESVFLSNILVGLIVLIVPILLNGLLSVILHGAFGLGDYFSVSTILWWTGMTILINLLIFSITVFTGIITGISTLQGILSFIFLFLPIGLGMLVLYNLERFLYGFYYNRNIEEVLSKISPIVRMLGYSFQKFSVTEIIFYVGVTLILLITSTYLYKKRKSETATQSIVFDWLKPVFKYGVTFCAMTFGGIYFGETQGRGISWVIFGYVVGSLIGYIIAEMIIRKSFNIIKQMKGYVLYALVIVILLVGVKIDIIGYENYVPDIEDIESANFGNYNYYYNNYIDGEIDLGLKNPDNIKAITDLHKEILNNKSTNIKNNYNVRRVNFVYELNNGKIVNRGYDIKYEDYEKFFKPIYESLEYKMLINPIFAMEEDKVDKMSISPIYGNKPIFSIIDIDEIKEAITILKEDIKNETFEEMNSGLAPWSSVSFLLNDDKRVTVNFKKNYTGFENWLKEKGYYENARIMSDDISYVKIARIEDKEMVRNENIQIQEPTHGMIDGDMKVFEIKDKVEIENLLRNYKESWTEDRKYQLEFFDEQERLILSGVLDNHIPQYIEEFFSK